MKSQKDITAAVKSAEQSLRIQPSSKAWQKLESRLDQRRPQKTNIVTLRKWMAIAASLVVLVVSLFFWSSNQAPQYDYSPTFVEELKGNRDCNPFCMNIEAIKALPAFYAVPAKASLNEQS